MDTTASRARLHPVIWLAAVSVTVLSFVGVGAILGWLPAVGSAGRQAEAALPALSAAPSAEPKAVAEPKAAGEPKPGADASHDAPAALHLDAAPRRHPAPRRAAGTVVARVAEPAAAPAAALSVRPAAEVRFEPVVLAQAPEAAAVRRVCAECGIVESVREVKQAGEGTGLGAVAGGIVGGLLGHQLGKGRGNTVATVAGAVGGAVAGHQVERSVRSTSRHEITVRMEEGGTRTVSVEGAPAWRPGDKVRVVDGRLLADN